MTPTCSGARKRREELTKPLHVAVEALDLSWEITGGNLAEIDQTLRRWEDGWQAIHNDGPKSHHYHRLLLRQFHNFLSFAVSTVWHARRIVGSLKGVAPGTSHEFRTRLEQVEHSDAHRLLSCLRDYAIHTGHHTTVLTLREATNQTGEDILVASVAFDMQRVRAFLEEETRRRPKNTGRRKELAVAKRCSEQPEMRDITASYYKDVGDLLRWLRKALLDYSSVAYARPLKEWSASPETWVNFPPDSDVAEP